MRAPLSAFESTLVESWAYNPDPAFVKAARISLSPRPTRPAIRRPIADCGPFAHAAGTMGVWRR